MTTEAFSLLVCMGILVPALALGVNIGVALMISGVAGAIAFTGSVSVGISLPLLQLFDIASSHPLIVIPLFILMGSLATQSGITTQLFKAFYVWMGRLPGGVAIATIGTCAGMSAVTGSSVAVAGAMCKIALPELRRYGYRMDLSVGAITVGGTLAILIPPSVTFVLFAIFSNASIGKLFVAGILPGFLLAAGYALLIAVRCTLNPTLGPGGPSFSLRERLAVLPGVIPFLGIVLAVLGGMLTGLWTPVESAAVGVILVLALGIARRQLGFGQIGEALIDAASSTAAIFMVVAGSLVFGMFLAMNGVTDSMSRTVTSWELTPLSLFMLLVVGYVIVGCFMEVTSILALTTPMVLPLVANAGWDIIWFGVVVVSLMEIAAVTPPVGLNLYAVKSGAPDVPLRTIYMGAMPFWLVNILLVAILYMYPQIALFLPGMM